MVMTVHGATGKVKYANTITVAKSGGDFTSVQAAIDSITDASETKRYTVLVYPGSYVGQITAKVGVSVIGLDRDACIIDAHESLIAVKLASHMRLEGVTTISSNPSIGVNCANIHGIGVENVSISNCNMLGGCWAVRLDGGSKNVYISNCTGNQPNPIYFAGADNCEVWDSNFVYDGTIAQCLTLVDAGGEVTNCTFGRCSLEAYHHPADPTTGGTFVQGLHLSPFTGNKYVDNVVDIVTTRQFVYGLQYDSLATLQSGAANVITGNTIRIHTSHATPVIYGINLIRNTSFLETRYLSNLYISGNDIAITSDNTPTVRKAIYCYDPDINNSLPVDPNTESSIKIDKMSLLKDSDTIEINNLSLSYLSPGKAVKEQKMQLVTNLAYAGVGVIWSLENPSGCYPIPMTEGHTQVLSVDGTPGGAPIEVPGYRCLVVSGADGTAAGKIKIHGWDWQGRYITDEFTVNGTTPVVGTKAFKKLWYAHVTLGGAGAVEIGTSNKLGLYESITTESDVLGFTRNMGAIAAPTSVDAVNSTITLSGTVDDGDDFAIYYMA